MQAHSSALQSDLSLDQAIFPPQCTTEFHCDVILSDAFMSQLYLEKGVPLGPLSIF